MAFSCLRYQSLFAKSLSPVNYSRYEPNKFSIRRFMKRPSREDGGMNLAPKIQCDAPPQGRIFPTLAKCFVFTVGFSGTVYVGASIFQYERIKTQIMQQNLSDYITSKWNKIGGFEHKEGEFRRTLNRWWNEIPEGGKVFWGICAINIFVFLCWRYAPLQSTMLNYFCSNPMSRVVCWPMMLSTFSHYAPLHLFMNMYVLNSFSNGVCNLLGGEQFLAFYLTGGVISSFTSNFFKLSTKVAGPSLGASGAIMAMIGYFCTKYPDAQLGIVFLPNFPFSASAALKGIMLLDISGLIFRWKLFDHAAHLGGAIFGVLYALYGQSLVWGSRSHINKQWEDFNNFIQKRIK